MAYVTLNLGILLTLPTSGTRNWGSTLYSTTWTRISQHRHTGSGDGNQLVTGSYADNSVTGSKLTKNLGLTQAATLAPSGLTQTVNWNDGNIQKMNLSAASGNVTLTLSNPVQGAMYKLFLIQGATFKDVLFPASVKWPQGQAPILSDSSGAIDIVDLYFDGSNYYADWQIGYA
jgi:hypothetical protein